MAKYQQNHNRISIWLENKKSTTDCMFILNGLLEILFSQGKKLYACFFDYTKAFDLLDRSAVFYKLFKNGVSSKVLNIIKSLYNEVILSVKGEEKKSSQPKNGVFNGTNYDEKNSFQSNYGLLQGESLSPLLFSLYVNDLPELLNNVDIGIKVQEIIIKLLMFADDTVVFSETIEGLQKGIDSVRDYCRKWGITVNVPKTKVLVFKKGGKVSKNEKWNFGNLTLEVVKQFNYVGCIFTSSGNFTACMNALKESGKRALFLLSNMFHVNQEILPFNKLQLFNSKVLPILSYGSEVWGMNNIDCIETFYLFYLKNVLCVKKSTPNSFVYDELGLYPLKIEFQIRALKYWLKVIRLSLPHDSLRGELGRLNRKNRQNFHFRFYVRIRNINLLKFESTKR